MKDTFKTRCKNCDQWAPKLGDGGYFGTPSASRLERHDLELPSFGYIYDGFASACLLNPTMDRYFSFLCAHRRHKLELISTDPDLSCDESPWSAKSEPRLPGNLRSSYARSYYGIECTECGKRFASEEPRRLRRFVAGPVDSARLAKFVDHAWMVLDPEVDNDAAPLAFRDLERVGAFIHHRHPGHAISLTLLHGPKARAKFLSVRRPKSPVRKAPSDLTEWWARLEVTQWCREVPKRELSRLRRALKSYADNPTDAFLALSPAGFDAESIENDGDYSRILSAYSKASCGALRLSEVKDSVDWNAERARVSFRANGKKFSREFPQLSDYVSDDFVSFMNDVMEATGETKRFHELPTGDQTVQLVCVTRATFTRARKQGLIPSERNR